MSGNKMPKKITILDFKKKKEEGRKIHMLVAYDFQMAGIIDSCGVDAILVGDSAGMVMMGYDSTIPVTVDDIIHYSKCVKRAVKSSFIIGDMPFLSYQASNEDAVRNAGRMIKEGGCEAVKVEGGSEMCPRIEAIINAGIPVLGHLGLMPQSINKIGAYKVQGRNNETAKKILRDALFLEKSGCFAVILECVPVKLAEKITGELSIPAIGIGAGRMCDGQVLVTHDMIGFVEKPVPKFVKKYANVGDLIRESVEKFKQETENGTFPGEENSYR